MNNFVDLGKKLGELVQKKNAAYGDATKTGAEAMRLLYPGGIKPEQYETFAYSLLVWHKLSRIATDPGAFGEDPIQDIAGYSLLLLSRAKEEKPKKEMDAVKYVVNNVPCYVCGLSMYPDTLERYKARCWPCHKDRGGKLPEKWGKYANQREIDALNPALTRINQSVMDGKVPEAFAKMFQEMTKNMPDLSYQRAEQAKSGDRKLAARWATKSVREKYPGYWLTERGEMYWVITAP